MTLPQMSYKQHYAPPIELTPDDFRTLADLMEMQSLPCHPALVIAIERNNYAVDLFNGDVFADNGQAIVKVGHVDDYEATTSALLDNIYSPRKDGSNDDRTDS